MKAVLVMLILMLSSVAWAADTGRRYDSNNQFQGTYRVNESGTIRLYDEKGLFEGTIVPRRDMGSFRRYNWNGTFLGSGRADESEGEWDE